MARMRRGMLALGLLVALGGGLFVGGSARTLTQDGTPEAEAEGRPVHILSGNCAEGELGDVIQGLTNLTEPEGESAGQEEATGAETSFTTVPLALDDLLAEDHAINAHLSEPEIGTYIACGEIGGVLDENGSLVIGLREQDGSGFSGIAFLSPNLDDDTQTDVSVFIAEGLSVSEGEEDEGDPGAGEDADAEVTPAGEEDEEEDADASPEASGDGEAVEVLLSEWEIDMPDTLPAGPITFDLVNNGEFPHTIEIEGEGVEEGGEVTEAGETSTFEVELDAGTYTIYCPVGDGRHREAGMELEVTVE